MQKRFPIVVSVDLLDYLRITRYGGAVGCFIRYGGAVGCFAHTHKCLCMRFMSYKAKLHLVQIYPINLYLQRQKWFLPLNKSNWQNYRCSYTITSVGSYTIIGWHHNIEYATCSSQVLAVFRIITDKMMSEKKDRCSNDKREMTHT